MPIIRPGGGYPVIRQFPGQGIPQVNPNHPLARGLLCCFVTLAGGVVVDALRPRGVASGTPLPLSRHGVTANPLVSASFVNTCPDLNWTSGAFATLIWTAFQSGHSASFQDPFDRAVYVAEGNNNGWAFQWTPSLPGLVFQSFANESNPRYNFNLGSSTYPSSDIMLGFQTSDATSWAAYINGVQSNSGSGRQPGGGSIAPGSCSSAPSVACYIACVWFRALAQYEITEFYLNPYGMLIYPEDSVPWIQGVVTAGASPFASGQFDDAPFRKAARPAVHTDPTNLLPNMLGDQLMGQNLC